MSTWRPTQWAQGPPPWSITPQGGTTKYFFDGVRVSDHYFQRVFTKYPVQVGASVTYHSYQMQDRVILEVIWSDTMQSYIDGQYSSSINAAQTFINLMKAGTLMMLSTRLYQYSLMGITDIRISDDVTTNTAVKAAIVFEQLIVAALSTQVVSSRPDQSQTTQTGSQQSTPVPTTTVDSFTSAPVAATPPSAPNDPNPNPAWNSETQFVDVDPSLND